MFIFQQIKPFNSAYRVFPLVDFSCFKQLYVYIIKEIIKYYIQKIFKEHGLDNITQCNMKIVNYLDVTFNLNDGTYKPYSKPNNEIKYIRKNSNHPPDVIRRISLCIESRLSTLSFSEKIFQ